MNARELESYHIYRKVQAFLDHWAALFFAINASALRTSFDALVEQLAMFVAKQHQQEHVRRGGANHIAVLRTRLVEDHIDPIIAMGAILERKLPQLRLRAPKTDGSAMALCTHADALAKTVAPFTAEFIALGLPADFLEQLRAAAGVLDTASTNHGMTEGIAVGATAGVAATVKETNEHLYAIATLVRKEIRDRPEVMAEWEKVRRLPSHRPRGITGGANRPALPAVPKPLILSAPEGPSQARALLAGVAAADADVEAAKVKPAPEMSVDVDQAPPHRLLWAKARHLLGGG